MAIITYQDLETYMNKTFTSGQQAAANLLIGSLERELEGILNRSLSGKTITDEKHLLKRGQKQIFLKEWPVNSVTAIKIGELGSEVTQTVTDYDTAGMAATEQQQLEGIMLRVCAREMAQVMSDALGLERLRAEGVDMTFANAGKAGFFTEDDLYWVARYRRRGVY